MVELFVTYLSTKLNEKSKKLGYRAILFIVDIIGSSGKTIRSQLLFYRLNLSNYLVINYIPGAKIIQELLRAVAINKNPLFHLHSFR